MKHALLFLSFFCCIICKAQTNLVPNPSFEEFSECPNENFDFIHLAVGWSSYRNTPDYFNRCSTDTLSSVPRNFIGYQEPATGNGYTGLFGFNRVDEYREIIGSKMTIPLVMGQTYYVSFKVSAVYGGYADIEWFSNKLGIKFLMSEYDRNNTPVPINNFAHVYTNTIITDTTNWKTIAGSFTADLPYQYVAIGNFFDNANTDTITNGIANYASYYFIDDVCVTTDPMGCNFTLGIDELASNNITLYPNPVKDILHVIGLDKVEEVKIYNIAGEIIKASIEYGDNALSIDVSSLPKGMYYITLKEQSIIVYKSFSITH